MVKKGASITVDPIRDPKALERIKKNLLSNPRDYCLFICGINNGLRISDLLNLKVSQVKGLKSETSIYIKEKKTKKKNVFMVNKAVYSAIRGHLDTSHLKDEDYLFPSRKTPGKPLTIQRAWQLVSKWCRDAELVGNFGSHTLRKTFGYMQRTRFGTGFEVLCRRFNHSSPAVTMRYLGVEDAEVNGILLNEI